MYRLISLGLFIYRPWAEDNVVQSIAYSLYQVLPLLVALFVIYKAGYLVRALRLEGTSEPSRDVEFGKWDLRALAQMATLLLSGYLILTNIVPFISALVDFFVDAVRLKYPYTTDPNETGYMNQYNFWTSAISILLGVLIITNIPWFVDRLVGKYEHPGGQEE